MTKLNIGDYFLLDRLRDGHGDKVAVRFGDKTYTYRHIADRSLQFAHWLRAHGISREQRVYIVCHDSPAFVWAFFGALLNGSVVAMGNPEAPASELAYVLDYIRPAALVTMPRVAAGLADRLAVDSSLRALLLVPEVTTGGDVEAEAMGPGVALPHLVVSPLANAIAAASNDSELPAVDSEDMAIWLFTSGSTGRPKAAMHTHGGFIFNTEAYAKATVGYRSSDVTVSVPRLFFGYATGTNLLFPFSVGASVGLYAERPTVESLARAIEMYRPTIVTNVPTMMGKLLDYDDELTKAKRPGLDLSSVRFHLSAGEALPPALLERFRERFSTDVYDGIGSAEMFHIYASNRPSDTVPGSLGRAVDGYRIKILPPDAEGPGAPELAAGETGVLWVSGESIALGYYRDRAKSRDTFRGAFCRTGDLFRKDDAGYLWFAGRADDLLKVGGVWVAPLEVEQCLMTHPDVAMAAVIGIGDAGLVKPKAYVVVDKSAAKRLTSDYERARLRLELQDYVKTRLSKHKYPRSIVFLDDLPRNDRGKIDRRALGIRESQGEGAS